MQRSVDVVVVRPWSRAKGEKREERENWEKNKKKKKKTSGDGRTYAIEIMISLVEEEKEKRY